MFIDEFKILRKKSNRELIWSMVKSRLAGENKGAVLGGLWHIVFPLFVMLVYSFVFGYIFSMRANSFEEYFLVVLTGFLFWFTFSDNMNQGCMVIRKNSGYIKKISFSKKILPMNIILFNLVKQFFMYIIVVGFYVFLMKSFSWKLLVIPIIMFFHSILCYSIILFTSPITTYFTDLVKVINLLLRLLMYLSIVLYPLSFLKNKLLQEILLIGNPIAAFIHISRMLIFENEPYTSLPIISIGVWSVFFYLVGSFLFKKFENDFVDVL